MKIFRFCLVVLFFQLPGRFYADDEFDTIKSMSFPDLVWQDMKEDLEKQLVFQIDKLTLLPSTILWGDTILWINALQKKYVILQHQQDFHTDDRGYRFSYGAKYLIDGVVSDNRGLILSGAGWFLSKFYLPSSKIFYRQSSDGMIELLEAKRRRINRESLEWAELPNYGFVDDGIKTITAWSELTEMPDKKKIIYLADNMRRPIIVTPVDSYSFELNQISPPWAEGVPGPGIGGTIDVEFTRPSNKLIILNGYVDLTKRHLYKENNRLKTIRIDSIDPPFSTTAGIEDVVQFHEIALPQATTKVRLTILDVYKGTKYDDTCISKIFIPQRELRPRAEYEAEVEKALRMAGYLK